MCSRESRAHTEVMPEDAAWADPVVVPDDIRDLQADVDAYHRELRVERRRARWQRVAASPTWQRWGFPAGVLTGALALAAIVFVLLAVDGRARPATLPAPLASPSAPPGAAGGLIPATMLTTTTGNTVDAQALRPALVVLLPPRCDCTKLLDTLAGQAEEVQLSLVVVGPVAPDAEVAAVPGQLHYTQVVAAYDPTGTLARVYHASGVTALVLGRDGVVTFVKQNVTALTRLELPLETALLLPPSAAR